MSPQSKLSSTTPKTWGRRAFLQRSAIGLAPAAVLAATGTTAKAQGEPGRGQGVRQVFASIRDHENAHVTFLATALGAAARPKPTFQGLVQRNYGDFFRVSQALENTGVGAYLGAAPAILSRGILAAAGSIATVEARHAGVLNVFLDQPITPGNSSFDAPLTPADVGLAAGSFIASLNGGPPLTYSTVPSDANDIAILNFALALEYLEAEFYNVNVPRFFR